MPHSIITYTLFLFFIYTNAFGVSDTGQVVYIPVVVHIVYNTSEENISNERVFQQLDALNRDFRAINSDKSNIAASFTGMAADAKIEFLLTTKDPEGNTHNGITRTQTNRTLFSNDDIYFTTSGGKDAWDTDRYLNIWVCKLVPGVFGFASFPGGNAATDGVVIDYRYIGVGNDLPIDYRLGRTAVHEIGHWLNLQHPWGTGGCSSDDGIEDTPLQEAAHSSCNLSHSSCGNLDMVQNFMNTQDDNCLLFFTPGQVARMRETLFNTRVSILEASPSLVAVNEYIAKPLISLFPNPANDYVYIKIPETTLVHGLIYGVDGGLVKKISWFGNEYKLDVRDLDEGLYFLQTHTDYNIFNTLRFWIRHTSTE